MYVLLDLADELDLSEILITAQAKDPHSEKGVDLRIMRLLLLYAYCLGMVSSRKLDRACNEDLDFRALTGHQQPDHSQISDLRRSNLDASKVYSFRFCGCARRPAWCGLGMWPWMAPR